MLKRRLSLQNRVFLAMVALVVMASVLIALVTIFQYNEQAQEYNTGRFERKETAIRKHINFEMRNSSFPIKGEFLLPMFQSSIKEISDVHNLEVEIYDLQGNFIISSNDDIKTGTISEYVFNELSTTIDHRFVSRAEKDGIEFQSSYTYLLDDSLKRIGILHLPYLEDSSALSRELREFLSRLAVGFLIMFAFGLALAYFISSYITRSIKTVSDKISQTAIHKRNEKIVLNDASKEIHNLVDSYNRMIDDLEESAVKLAQNEREEAWREMAKQVAHEIKNPLTPMRLTVQSFERKFDPADPNIDQKLKEYSNSLIQQIDVMSSIASAFSDFAKMPTQKREEINLVEVIKNAMEIFPESYISFSCEENKIMANLDKMQIIRVVTNLVKNSIQATETIENPKIEVALLNEEGGIQLKVTDNGKGISTEVSEMVFEPKFTTKSSGMGLGLPMIKNIIEAYNGSISFTSKKEIGTEFIVTLPKE
ncbi:sensor histidine kinase [Urechidicola vernalis]|uniref:histidine kinase n=1 Tax=Urechidicola vernalis TaxID=3075600 RepID=A0ABU2Y9D0_9FLAO|nr:ATP-binding protein [Urechidicola sp. P050]MDT0554264.1 ATP-binding protein [Urechidicola sp. P050]